MTLERVFPRLRLTLWTLVFSLAAPLCAQADSAIDLVYLGGSTGACTGTSGNPSGSIVNGFCEHTVVGDVVRFAITLHVDAAGARAWSVDLAWDSGLQNSLTLLSSTYPSTLRFDNPTPPPDHISYAAIPPESPVQSTASVAGRLNGVSGANALDPSSTIHSTSFRAATVTFQLDRQDLTSVNLGFFATDTAFMVNAAAESVTPTFGSFRVGDNCPLVENPGQEDTDSNGTGDACNESEDADGDEWADDLDTCPSHSNPGQEDADNNGTGDLCNDSEDSDGDDWADVLDNCPLDANPSQLDSSGNGDGDVCNDADQDGLLDRVETNTGTFVSPEDTGTNPLLADSDDDGIEDGTEINETRSDPTSPDTDADTFPDGADNCVLIANADQTDADGGADEDSSLPGIQQYGDLCDADLDSGGFVNSVDFFDHFQPCLGVLVDTDPECDAADFDGDGEVYASDFEHFLTLFGEPPGPGAEIPAALIAWGRDNFRQVSNAPTDTTMTEIVGGWFHTLALATSGTITSWGDNTYGQVSGTPSDAGFTLIAGGAYHSLALAADGSVVSWGDDSYGQVSDTVAGTGFTGIAGGWFHSVALAADGSLVSWGLDYSGQVSDIPTTAGFTAVAAGGEHGLALAADGSVTAWGDDFYDQVSNTPGGSGFTAVAAGSYFSLALAADGSIHSWGDDSYGQVSNAPTGAGFIAIAARGRQSLALASNGALVSWGWDEYGQVSDAPAGVGFTAIAAGAYHGVVFASEISGEANVKEITAADIAFLETYGGESDADGDGLSEGLEALFGTDPLDPDTDGNGVTDGDQILLGMGSKSTSVPSLGAGTLVALASLLLAAGIVGARRRVGVRRNP